MNNALSKNLVGLRGIPKEREIFSNKISKSPENISQPKQSNIVLVSAYGAELCFDTENGQNGPPRGPKCVPKILASAILKANSR